MVGLRQLRFLMCQRNSYPETNSAVFILLAENKARFWLETTTIHLRKQLSPSPAFLPSKGDLLRAGLSEPFTAGDVHGVRLSVSQWHQLTEQTFINIIVRVRCTRTLLLYGDYNQPKFTKVEFTVPITCVLSVSKSGRALAGCHPEPRVPLGEVLPFSFFFYNLHLHGTLAAMHYSAEH